MRRRVLPRAQATRPACSAWKNPGYAGRAGFPARQNHRFVDLKPAAKRGISSIPPYLYYNEHCIVFNEKHQPMHIDRTAFEKLFDFVSQFPHYFIGSNADLPIVGGVDSVARSFPGRLLCFP